MFVEGFRVESPRVRYGDGEIESEYRYDTTEVVAPPSPEKGWVVRPKSVTYHFKTTTTVPNLGYYACIIKHEMLAAHLSSHLVDEMRRSMERNFEIG